MKKILLFALLTISTNTFAQAPLQSNVQSSNNDSKYILQAGQKGVIGMSLLIVGTGITLFAANRDNENYKKRIKPADNRPFYYIGAACGISGFFLQMSGWNSIRKAGKSSANVAFYPGVGTATCVVTF